VIHRLFKSRNGPQGSAEEQVEKKEKGSAKYLPGEVDPSTEEDSGGPWSAQVVLTKRFLPALRRPGLEEKKVLDRKD